MRHIDETIKPRKNSLLDMKERKVAPFAGGGRCMTAILLGDKLWLEKELNLNWWTESELVLLCATSGLGVLLFPIKDFAWPIAANGMHNQLFKILAALYFTSLYMVWYRSEFQGIRENPHSLRSWKILEISKIKVTG